MEAFLLTQFDPFDGCILGTPNNNNSNNVNVNGSSAASGEPSGKAAPVSATTIPSTSSLWGATTAATAPANDDPSGCTSVGSSISECTLPAVHVEPSADAAPLPPRSPPSAQSGSCSSSSANPAAVDAAANNDSDDAIRSNVFVCQLPASARDPHIHALFAPFGPIESAKVMLNIHTGQSRGIAFVKFASPDDAARAIQALDGTTFLGNQIVVRVANAKAAFKPGAPTNKTFVRNIPLDVTRDQLATYFGKFGRVSDICVLPDNVTAVAAATGTFRNIVFVTYATHAEAHSAAEATHTSMPFPSCNGIPLLAKVAEDSVRRSERLTRRVDEHHHQQHQHQHHQNHQSQMYCAQPPRGREPEQRMKAPAAALVPPVRPALPLGGTPAARQQTTAPPPPPNNNNNGGAIDGAAGPAVALQRQLLELRRAQEQIQMQLSAMMQQRQQQQPATQPSQASPHAAPHMVQNQGMGAFGAPVGMMPQQQQQFFVSADGTLIPIAPTVAQNQWYAAQPPAGTFLLQPQQQFLQPAANAAPLMVGPPVYPLAGSDASQCVPSTPFQIVVGPGGEPFLVRTGQ